MPCLSGSAMLENWAKEEADSREMDVMAPHGVGSVVSNELQHSLQRPAAYNILVAFVIGNLRERSSPS